MRPRDRRRRRLLGLAAVCCLVLCLAVAAFFVRGQHLEARARAGRERGLQLLEQGDYFSAMHAIGPWVRRHPEDVEAVFAYALAREEVPEPNNRHLRDAMSHYRRVLYLQADHRPAADRLLSLYESAGFTTETLQLTEQRLDLDPDDVVALEARAKALFRLRRFEDAAQLAVRLGDRSPEDVEAQYLSLEILRHCPAGDQRVLERLGELSDRYSGDMRAELLRSFGLALLSRLEEAADCARRAARMPVTDAATLRLLVTQCEALGLLDESMDLLEVATRLTPADAEVMLRLAQRKYQAGDLDFVLKLRPDETASPVLVTVLQCLALDDLDRREEALRLLESLSGNEAEDGVAVAWSPLLRLKLAEEVDQVELMLACRRALAFRPDDPQLQMLAAEAFADVGDIDASLQALEQAARLAPAWSRPLTRLGAVALAEAQWDGAQGAAQAALARNPNDREGLLLLAVAKTNQAINGGAASMEEAVDACDNLERSFPGEFRAVPLRIQLLAEAQRTPEASGLLLKALQDPKAVPMEVLLHLELLSSRYGLGLEADCLDACEQAYGLQPPVALRKARRLYEGGREMESRKLLDELASAESGVGAPGAPPEYAMARARFLEDIQDPAAAHAWVVLVERHPRNVSLLWAALNSRAAQQDHEFVGSVLELLKNRLGGPGADWRMARARWLLASPEANGSEPAVEAALILTRLTREDPDRLAARLLLAEALRRLNKPDSVIEQLTVAANLDSSSIAVSLHLARTLHAQGHRDRASHYVQRVLQSDAATPEQRGEAAELAAALGEAQSAVAALQRMGTYGIPDLLMARLHWRANNLQMVEALCKNLLAGSRPEEILFVVSYWLWRGNASDAESAAAQIPAGIPAGRLARAKIKAHAGDLAGATAELREALREHPGDARCRRFLLEVLARHGRIEPLLQVLYEEETNAGPATASLAAVGRDAAEMLRQWPAAVDLLLWLLDHPDDRRVVEGVFDVLKRHSPEESAAALAAVERLTEENPRVLPLQLLSVTLNLQEGRPVIAASIASRAAQAVPSDSTSSRLAATAFSMAQQWPEAAAAAKQWRMREPGSALEADLLLAEALARTGAPSEAAAVLAAHDERQVADPQRRARLIVERAKLAMAVNDFEEAAGLLRGLLPESQEVRFYWLALVAQRTSSVEVALDRLEEAARAAAPGDFRDHVALIDAARTAADRLAAPRLADVATKQLQALNAAVLQDDTGGAGGPDVTELVLLGMLNERCGHKEGAAAAYERALHIDPADAISANNLAMLLLDVDSDRALSLARIATVAGGPASARFLDTLAGVHEHRGELDLAISSSRRAVAAAPQSAPLQVRLARLLLATGQGAEAARLLERIDPGAGQAPEVSQEIVRLRSQLKPLLP